jgi:hypothetical protein
MRTYGANSGQGEAAQYRFTCQNGKQILVDVPVTIDQGELAHQFRSAVASGCQAPIPQPAYDSNATTLYEINYTPLPLNPPWYFDVVMALALMLLAFILGIWVGDAREETKYHG